MKRLVPFLAGMLVVTGLFAQSSGLLSYQAVVRDADQMLIVNQTVGMQISILQGSASGTLVYTETQTPTTNINGLVSLEIGNATGYDTINWTLGPYFVKIEIDPDGGTNYSISGTSQLLSVPFALYADMAKSLSGPVNELDPVFTASVAAGITETDTAYWNQKLDYEIDGDSTNELQNIYLQSDSMVVLTDGGFFYLPPEEDPVFAASVAAGITSGDTAAWNNIGVEVDPIFAASIAAGITGMDTAYWNAKLDAEVDPVFAASIAAGITGMDTAYWNAKLDAEVDPVFAASIAAGITGMDTAYWNAKLDTEVDPVFAASISAGITGADTAAWNAKLDTEVDPVFAASIAAGITGADTAAWNAKLDTEVDPVFAASLAAGITAVDTALWNSNVPVWSKNGNDAYYNTGNVGVGTSTPGHALTVAGTVESTSGGFMFPDGTVQTTAATGSGLPPGMIVPFAGNAASVPAGWMLCDGTAISRATYAALFTVIGTNYGSGDGSTTFNIPDLRGMFLRGVDNGAGNDPDAATRTASNPGGNTGDNVGSIQFFASSMPVNPFSIGAGGDHTHGSSMGLSGNHVHSGSTFFAGYHNHSIAMQSSSILEAASAYSSGSVSVLVPGGLYNSNSNGNHAHSVNLSAAGSHSHSLTITNAGSHSHSMSGGDSETRPSNVYVNYIIKL